MSDRPAVTLKLATSLDGRIATASGESRWITGEAARLEVHRLRAAHDAILVGSETAIQDDPDLTVRHDAPPERPPIRVVLDTRLRLPLTSRLALSARRAPVIVFAAPEADPESRAVLETLGVRVLLVARSAAGLDVSAVLAALGREGASSVFVEGGGAVAASMLCGGVVDRLEWFRAPIALGAEGKPAVGDLQLTGLGQAPRFRRLEVREVGPDLWERYGRS